MVMCGLTVLAGPWKYNVVMITFTVHYVRDKGKFGVRCGEG